MEDAASEVYRVRAFPALCHAASPSVAPQPNRSADVLGAPSGERISNRDATRPAGSKPMYLTAVGNPFSLDVECHAKAIQTKLDRLGEAFLFAEAIDAKSYERQRDRLREELTFAQIDHHADSIEELDVEGILAFAERILPRASEMWVQASLDQRQRLQQLFFPDGVAFGENGSNRTAATAPFFKYLAPSEDAEEGLVSREGIVHDGEPRAEPCG